VCVYVSVRVCVGEGFFFTCGRKVDGRYQYDQQVVKLGQQWVVSGNLYATRVLMFGLAALATPAQERSLTLAPCLTPVNPMSSRASILTQGMHPTHAANH
jgi:hypothetical protein